MTTIKDYPNYLIYEDGRVYSKDRQSIYTKGKRIGMIRNIKGRKLTPTIGFNGYYRYVLIDTNNNRKYPTLHRLLAIHYIPNPNNYKFVDHINRDRLDNRLENLRWVSQTENNNNTNVPSTNKSGHKNIYYMASESHKDRKKRWVFRRGGDYPIMKYFLTKEEAIDFKEKFCKENYLELI